MRITDLLFEMISAVFLLYSYEYVFKHIFGELRGNVVDEDDDIIDDEDALPHDLVDSDDEDIINVDDDSVDKQMLHGPTAVTVAVKIVPLHTMYPPVARVALLTETQFDLRPHMESPDWTEIDAGIQQHLWARPEAITTEEWDKYIQFWNDPKNISQAAQNRQNRAKSTVISRQGSRSLARLRNEM
nr:hypothetical protein [Tanacetum cinerariifolium]